MYSMICPGTVLVTGREKKQLAQNKKEKFMQNWGIAPARTLCYIEIRKGDTIVQVKAQDPES